MLVSVSQRPVSKQALSKEQQLSVICQALSKEQLPVICQALSIEQLSVICAGRGVALAIVPNSLPLCLGMVMEMELISCICMYAACLQNVNITLPW